MDDKVVAMTIPEAVKRYPGTTTGYFARLLRKGARLLKKYKRIEDVPRGDRAQALFGAKTGKFWFISEQELERFFLR